MGGKNSTHQPPNSGWNILNRLKFTMCLFVSRERYGEIAGSSPNHQTCHFWRWCFTWPTFRIQSPNHVISSTTIWDLFVWAFVFGTLFGMYYTQFIQKQMSIKHQNGKTFHLSPHIPHPFFNTPPFTTSPCYHARSMDSMIHRIRSNSNRLFPPQCVASMAAIMGI